MKMGGLIAKGQNNTTFMTTRKTMKQPNLVLGISLYEVSGGL